MIRCILVWNKKFYLSIGFFFWWNLWTILFLRDWSRIVLFFFSFTFRWNRILNFLLICYFLLLWNKFIILFILWFFILIWFNLFSIFRSNLLFLFKNLLFYFFWFIWNNIHIFLLFHTWCFIFSLLRSLFLNLLLFFLISIFIL